MQIAKCIFLFHVLPKIIFCLFLCFFFSFYVLVFTASTNKWNSDSKFFANWIFSLIHFDVLRVPTTKWLKCISLSFFFFFFVKWIIIMNVNLLVCIDHRICNWSNLMNGWGNVQRSTRSIKMLLSSVLFALVQYTNSPLLRHDDGRPIIYIVHANVWPFHWNKYLINGYCLPLLAIIFHLHLEEHDSAAAQHNMTIEALEIAVDDALKKADFNWDGMISWREYVYSLSITDTSSEEHIDIDVNLNKI